MSAPETGDGTCALCGLALSSSRDGPVEDDDGATYCCRGCRSVDAALADVGDVDEAALQAAEAGGEETGDEGPPPDHERAFLRVDGMHCATCETFVEALAAATDGVAAAEASYVTETVRVDYDPSVLSVADVTAALSTAGYTAHPREETTGPHRAEDTLLWRLAAGVLLGMWVMVPYVVYVYPVHFGLLPPWLHELARRQLEQGQYLFAVLFVFTTLVLVVAGGPILRGAYVSLRAQRPNMDLLVALAATSAYCYSTLAVALGRIDVYYDVTVAVVVVVTAGTYYESRVKRRATDHLAALQAATVDEATLYHADGSTTAVDVDDLSAGDRVLVRAGDRVPVDGTVSEGDGTADEAVVTGESLPVAKRPGDDVVGGSVLTDGALVVAVDDGATSSVDRLTDLMWNLQSADHGVQRLADRLAVVFVPGVLTLAVVAGAASFALGASATGSLLVALTVLLVSCPCALGLATPLAVASGVREAVARGVVVFDETVFERLRDVDTVVFDKTGTLTTGDLRVREADAPDDLLRDAAALERRSAHPVAAALAEAFGADRAAGAGDAVRSDGGTAGDTPADGPRATRPVAEFQRHPTGVEGVVDGTRVLVGHPDLFAARDWAVPDAVARRASAARDAGDLPVVVGRDGAAEGLVVLGDEPREAWSETLADLRDRGFEVVVLTGDDERATRPFGDHPAVDRVFAGVPPAAKAETVRRLARDRCVAMVGDGTNDGPALAAADLGVALGSGTALAVDAADVAVVDDDLSSIATVVDLAAAAGRRVRQNVGWAFCYNAVAVPLAALGYLNPLVAAAAMASSSLLVVTNSSRALLDES